MMRDIFPPHGAPCARCGVRPDIACTHRPADAGYRPPVQETERDGRSRPDAADAINIRLRLKGGGGSYPVGTARKVAR